MIIDRFSALLRRFAVTKPVIKEASVAAYVDMILAPDTALRLIMEDLNLGVVDALGVMEESHEMGDLLYPCDD